MVFDENANPMQLMMMIMELSRGHSESAIKSERVGEAWREKKRRAQTGEAQVPTARMGQGRKALTLRLPSWVRLDGGALILDPAKAATVRRVYTLAREGLGVAAIAQALNREGVPLLGRTTFKNRPVVWSEPIVYHLLTTRTVLGEYQPCQGRGSKRQPCGDPVPNYYPAVIDAELFYAVGGLLKARAKCARGRRGSHINLFAGLLVDARDGGSLTYKHLRNRPATLIPVGAKQGRGTRWSSFPAGVFEDAILSKLAEITGAEIWSQGGAGQKVEELAGRLAEVKDLVSRWTAKMDNPNLVDTVAAKLAELNVKQKALAEELADAQREAASPLSESWGEFRSLTGLLARNKSDELRLKIRAALRRSVESVCCLFAGSARGSGERLAAVQIFFRKSAEPRMYIVQFRPPRGNGHTHQDGKWRVKSSASAPVLGRLDLRQREHAVQMELVLSALNLDRFFAEPGSADQTTSGYT
jgi:hypothetical protein